MASGFYAMPQSLVFHGVSHEIRGQPAQPPADVRRQQPRHGYTAEANHTKTKIMNIQEPWQINYDIDKEHPHRQRRDSTLTATQEPILASLNNIST